MLGEQQTVECCVTNCKKLIKKSLNWELFWNLWETQEKFFSENDHQVNAEPGIYSDSYLNE